VFTLTLGTAGKTAAQRARQASRALQAILDSKEEPNVRTVPQGDVIAVVAGDDPIIALTQADAEAAGEASLELYAAEVTAAVRRALQAERARSRVAHTVFSVSLVVFLGLLSLFAMRKLGELSDRARLWVSDHAATFSLRFRRIELVPPAMVQSAAYVALSIGKRVAQLGLLYIWLVATLSLFEATRGATQRLTGWVITPASHLVTRLVTALPLLVVFVIAAAAVWVLLQFVTLYFSSIARGETKVAAIPPSLAPTVSILLRVGIVLAALLLGAPLATGDSDGALPRIGSLILLTLGLASTPLVACFVVGVWTVFARRMAVGDEVRIGDFEGRIDSVGLMETRLLGNAMESVAIPHLLLLRLAVARREGAPWIRVSLSLAPQTNPSKAKELLRQAALDIAPEVQVSLTAADGRGFDYDIAIRHRDTDARSRLLERLLETVSAAGLELAQRPPLSSSQAPLSERAS
jgi:small-conductance mechanosensitive channel